MEGRRRRSSLLACAALGGLLAVAGCVGSEPERLVMETDVEAVAVGESAEIRIELFDDLDTPVPGAVVRLSADTPGTALSADEVVTGPAGAASVTLTAATRVGENRVEAVHGDLSASLVVPGVAGPPASFAVTADPARAVNGSAVAVAVAVTDRFDNAVPDVPVGLEAAPAAAGLDLPGGETDGAGSLTRMLTTAPEPGDNRVQVTVAELPPQTLVVPARRLSRLAVRPERAELVAGDTLSFEAVGFDDDGGELGGAARVDARGRHRRAGADREVHGGDRGPGTGAGGGRRRRGLERTDGGVGGRRSAWRCCRRSCASSRARRWRLRAVARDAGGNAVAPAEAVQWILTADVGDLDDRGGFTARRIGEAMVAAVAGGLRGEARVEVTAGRLVTIALEPRNLTVASGTERQFRAVGQDPGGNPVPMTPTWSLSDALGELDGTGRFRAVRAGTARLVVASGRVAASTEIEVVPGPLESIAVSPARAEVPAGTSAVFSAVGRDAAGNAVAVEPVWELSSPVGRIDAGGELTGGPARAGAGDRAIRRGVGRGGCRGGSRRADEPDRRAATRPPWPRVRRNGSR